MGSQLHGKLHKVLVGEQASPERSSVGVVIELPHMDELVEPTGVRREVANQVVAITATGERWPRPLLHTVG